MPEALSDNVVEAAVAVLDQVLGDTPRTPESIKAAMRRLPLKKLHAVDRMLGLPPRESLRDFIKRTKPEFVFRRWLEPLLDSLQEIADGTLHRLIVQAPPRVGKSELVSRLFPAYYLSLYPWRWCGIGSHGAQLAKALSRWARRNFGRGGGKLSKESASVSDWETTEHGGMWARGLDGGALGLGAHLAIIDDPSPSRSSLKSPAAREALIETYESVFYSRLEPDGALIIMAQRMHDRDLIGQLLAREDDDAAGEDGYDKGEVTAEGWRLIDFPSISEAPDIRPVYPASIDVVPEWREPGEALVPELWPLSRLRKTMRAMGPSNWASMHQQRPRPRDGSLFKWPWFEQRLNAIPAGDCIRVRYWDLAGTEGDGDFTVGLLMSFMPSALYDGSTLAPFVVEDVVRGQWSPARRNAKIKETADKDAELYGFNAVHQWLEAEAGIHGTDRTRSLVALLSGHIVYTERPTGDKEVRADPVAGQAEVGNVKLVEAHWNSALIEELCAFLGGGEHDDQVDAFSGAFNKLTQMAGEIWSETPFALV